MACCLFCNTVNSLTTACVEYRSNYETPKDTPFEWGGGKSSYYKKVRLYLGKTNILDGATYLFDFSIAVLESFASNQHFLQLCITVLSFARDYQMCTAWPYWKRYLTLKTISLLIGQIAQKRLFYPKWRQCPWLTFVLIHLLNPVATQTRW